MRSPARARSSALRACGFALIELIIAIVVIAIAVTSVLSVLSASAIRSSEILVREQAATIAAAYLDQVRSQPFSGVPGFNGLVTAGPSGLTQFTASVSAVPAALGGVPSTESYRIDVTVTHPNGIAVHLTGYRMLYP